MKQTKIILSIIALLLISAFMILPTQAATSLYSNTNTVSAAVNDFSYPSTSCGLTGIGNGGYLSAITLYLSAYTGTVTAGSFTMCVRNSSGTNIENSTSTFTITEQNPILDARNQGFSFAFSENTQLVLGSTYYFEIYLLNATTGTLAIDSSSGNTIGLFSSAVFTNHVYAGPMGSIPIGNIITVDLPEPTPTPTATPNPSTYQYWNGTHWVPYTPSTPAPNIFENGTATPYIQLLVPIIILACAALLGWKFAGAWGFFAGVNLGAILTYTILGSDVFPLWGIVALLIIDGLLLFGKVGLRS